MLGSICGRRLCRLLDRAAQLVLAHHRHDNVLPGDQTGQLRVVVDRAQEIAAQRQNDRDPAVRLSRRVAADCRSTRCAPSRPHRAHRSPRIGRPGARRPLWPSICAARKRRPSAFGRSRRTFSNSIAFPAGARSPVTRRASATASDSSGLASGVKTTEGRRADPAADARPVQRAAPPGRPTTCRSPTDPGSRSRRIGASRSVALPCSAMNACQSSSTSPSRPKKRSASSFRNASKPRYGFGPRAPSTSAAAAKGRGLCQARCSRLFCLPLLLVPDEQRPCNRAGELLGLVERGHHPLGSSPPAGIASAGAERMRRIPAGLPRSGNLPARRTSAGEAPHPSRSGIPAR